MQSLERPIVIIEDSPEDFETTCRALKKVNVRNEILHFASGEEALDYLFRKNSYMAPGTSPRPAIILLDLNLPGTDGKTILKKIKESENQEVSMIPVIVITTSKDQRDIKASYLKGASGYIQKPVNFDGFVSAIQNLKRYWLDTVLLPIPVDGGASRND